MTNPRAATHLHGLAKTSSKSNRMKYNNVTVLRTQTPWPAAPSVTSTCRVRLLEASQLINKQWENARVVERVNRTTDENRLTPPVFLNVAKAFDTVWVKGFLWKITTLNLPSYLLKTKSSLPNVPSVLPLSQIYTSWHADWYSPGWTRIPCAVEFVCTRHTHTLLPRRSSTVLRRHGS
jgi:hypothetical protein